MSEMTLISKFVSDPSMDFVNISPDNIEGSLPSTTISSNEPVQSEIGASWNNKALSASRKILRKSLSYINDGVVPDLYHDSKSSAFQRAKRVVEIFRMSGVSKNSSRLDTKRLQVLIAESIELHGRLRFSIAWGHAKRAAGGLKTFGSAADMAEVVALARLSAILDAIREASEVDVSLAIMSGGTRFQSALFTNARLNDAYDDQRRIIAAGIAAHLPIEIEPSSTTGPNVNDLLQSLDGRLSEAATRQHYLNILCNIDWENVLSGESDEGKEVAPFGLPKPSNLADRAFGMDAQSIRRLIRCVLISIIMPRATEECSARSGVAHQCFIQMVTYFERVARRSVVVYGAIQKLENNRRPSGGDSIRLTVHEKAEKQEVPAIYTLGRGAGNLLSQHVVPVVQANGEVRFIAAMQATQEMSALAVGSSEGLFGWLRGTEQPLCLFEAGASASALESSRSGIGFE